MKALRDQWCTDIRDRGNYNFLHPSRNRTSAIQVCSAMSDLVLLQIDGRVVVKISAFIVVED